MKLSILRRNLGYKLFALVLTIMLYYVANAQRNPRGTRDQYVQPEVVRLPQNLVVKDTPSLIPLSISGTESDLAQIDKQPLKALVDGSVVKEGLNRLPIMVALPKGVSLNNTPLPLAQFSAEKKEQREYAVDVDFSGTAPAGQEYSEPSSMPGSVVVQGLKDDLKRVGRIVASVEREQDELTVERTVNLFAEDSLRRKVDGVEIVPERVKVTVKLRPVPTTKTMVLSAEFVGKPAPGYRIATYDVTPNQIIVRGAVEALSARSSIPISVNVTGIKETVTKTVTLALPPGMSPQKALPPIQIRLYVEPIAAVDGGIPVPSPVPSSTEVASPLPTNH